MEAMVEGDGTTSPTQSQQQPEKSSNNSSSSTPAATTPPMTATVSVSRVNVVPATASNGVGNNVNPVLDVEAAAGRGRLGEGDGDDQQEGEGGKLQRKWEFFPGKNRFYCDGRVMTAPSIRFCVLSFALIFVTFTLFIIFDAPFLTERLSVAIPILGSLLFVSVVVNMVKTSFSDPGILPRASQQEADHLEKSYYSTNFRPPPRTKDIIVNGQVIKSKYCFTCKMFRPPRASHCGVCDNCVDRFDHHCPFLGNCIGKRNYRSFYTFIVSLSFLAVFVLSASIAHLAMLSKERGNFLEALRDSPSSAIVIIISFFGMWTVIGLTGFHTYLIAVEQTTNEDIKGLFGRANAKNPFSHGNFCQNCCFVLCGPSQPSLIDPRGIATPDFLASLPRKTDPNGMLSPGKVPQLTAAKPSSNNCASDQLGQQGTFVGGTNKIYREQPSAAQSVQPIQHQPLQFSSPQSQASSTTEVSNGLAPVNAQSFPGLPAIPPEEKILLKGQTRNGVRGVVDYRQTVPESAAEEIQMSQQEALISPSAASTVSLSTVSTSNMSTCNDYDTVHSPMGVTNSASVRLHHHQPPRNRNPNMTRRLFPSSLSSDQLEGVVDPSDFDDDLDMPSLSNINDNEAIRRTNHLRGISNNNGNRVNNGNALTKSTRSLPSTSVAAAAMMGDSTDINKIHVLDASFPSSSKASVNSGNSNNKVGGIPSSSASSAVGIRNKFSSSNGGARNLNNKRNLEPMTMQNSPLHLDTIM